MGNEILLFTGNSGAGKSTIARAVSSRLDAVHLSEREMSRDLARKEGFERSRLWAMSVGLEVVAHELRSETVSRIGEHEDEPVIIDGVYDRLLYSDILEEYTTRRLGIVAIEAAKSVRVRRCAERMGGVALSTAKMDVDYLDKVKEDIGGSEVIAMADLRILNEGSLNESVDRVVRFVESGRNL